MTRDHDTGGRDNSILFPLLLPFKSRALAYLCDVKLLRCKHHFSVSVVVDEKRPNSVLSQNIPNGTHVSWGTRGNLCSSMAF